jgi:hypothetical protein
MTAKKLVWKEGNFMIEKLVRCCGCGGNIAVAESRCANIGSDTEPAFKFSCSPECERDYEATR